MEVFKRETLLKVQLFLRSGVYRVAVELAGHNIHSLGRQGDIHGFRGRTHGKQKATPPDVVLHDEHDVALHLRDLVVTEFTRLVLVHFDLRLIPERVGERPVEFAVLPGEVFMVHVEPVVIFEGAVEHVFVVHEIIRDLCVFKGQPDGIVPRFVSRRLVDRDTGGFFEFHSFHVLDFNLAKNVRDLPGTDLFVADTGKQTEVDDFGRIIDKK